MTQSLPTMGGTYTNVSKCSQRGMDFICALEEFHSMRDKFVWFFGPESIQLIPQCE